jgi:hypothetical protein
METHSNGKVIVSESLQDQVNRLKAENDQLRASKSSGQRVSFKVSEKGAVSVYGLGRFPATFYKGQWECLFAHLDQLKAFIKAHESELSVK